jgi:hypothetical protein
MKIDFRATLQGSGCIRLDDDNSAVVKLTCSGTEIANVVKLLTLQGKTFKVTIEEER